ncbi:MULTISPECIES: hypothetical protein [Stutzerimonas stutzeri group]|uniref:Uncharacterized protein n=1 Tax=Stutzerimonas stutzeri TaxID=316 RepID=A0AA42P7K4_STUST|nr:MULTISPECIES: hypothetical protein [Stutzerimonas stutzeri group]MDH1235147.1 hypothetical protein [Stutzerimonas stutzeri]WOC80101.1 hypothetical protein RTE98_06080 [Stutzerimonas frequens]
MPAAGPLETMSWLFSEAKEGIVMMWPDHYPEQCPPSVAAAVSGKVFRFTNRTNPKPQDFRSFYEISPTKDWGNMACNARGLSVFSTHEDCIAAAEISPALRKKRLSVAELPRGAGVLAETPSNNTQNHKTFWSLMDAETLASFFVHVELTGGTN